MPLAVATGGEQALPEKGPLIRRGGRETMRMGEGGGIGRGVGGGGGGVRRGIGGGCPPIIIEMVMLRGHEGSSSGTSRTRSSSRRGSGGDTSVQTL